MEHTPRSYKTLWGVFRGMSGTLIGQVMREAVQRDVSILPFEVICLSDNTVKLIVSYASRRCTETVHRACLGLDWLRPGDVRARCEGGTDTRDQRLWGGRA
jgi:hypothetical protein